MLLFLLIMIPALGFGGWPIGARLAGTSSAWTNIILVGVTSIVLLAYYGRALRTDAISTEEAVKMTGVAICNGVALVFFAVLMQKYPQYVPIAQALMPIVSFVGAWKFLHVPASPGQVACLTVASLAIAGMGYFTPPQP